MVYSIRRLQLPVVGLEELRSEARLEGFAFIETLCEEWESRSNRFTGPGEVLRGCFDGDLLFGVGGLTLDPFAGDFEIGRIRRVYVRGAWRNRGIGRMLVNALVDDARKAFRAVRLRAESANAARFYERSRLPRDGRRERDSYPDVLTYAGRAG